MTTRKPPSCPWIYRDDDRIYLDFGTGRLYPFDYTEGGLTKALQHVPRMPGTRTDYKKQLKPDWAVTNGKVVKPKVASKTKRERELDKLKEYTSEADEAIRKLLDKK